MVVESEAFCSTRRKLNVLGYKEHFGEESLSLVVRLLDDLILATHGLRESKRGTSSKMVSELEEQNNILKAENSALKDECLCLNKNISEIHESYKVRIQDTRGPSCNSSRSNPDLDGSAHSNSNTSIPLPICIDGQIHPYACSGGKSLSGNANANGSENGDVVNTLAKRCSDLEANVLLLQKERELTEKRTAAFKKQIEVRNEEIDLLRQLTEEKLLEKSVLETRKSHADLMIGQLQAQVDLLQKRNEELEKRMFLRLEAISQSAFTMSSRRDCASQCELLKHPIDVKVDRRELADLIDNFEKISSHFLIRTDELVNCQKKMVLEIERLKRLAPPAKKLAQPVKRCAMRGTTKKPPPSSSAVVTRIGAAATSAAKQMTEGYEPPIKEYIEVEFFFVVGMCELFEFAFICVASMHWMGLTAPNSISTHGLLADRETLRAQVDYLNRSLRQWFTSGDAFTTAAGDIVGVGSQDAATQSLHPDATAGIRECDQGSAGLEFTSEDLQAEVSRLTYLSSHHYHHGQSAAYMSLKNDTEFETVKRERNELQKALNQFEQNLLKIQAEVRSLRAERDQLLLELEKMRKAEPSSKPPTFFSELNGSERSLLLDRQLTNNIVSNSNESVHDRDPAEVGRLSRHDHDELLQWKEEISTLTMSLATSRKQLEASQRRIEELEQQIEQLKCVVEQATSKKEEAEKLKEQLQTALVQTNGRNSLLASELTLRKNMCNEALKGKQLSDALVAEAQRNLQSLNAHVIELEAEIKCSHEEVSRLHKVTSQLDAEKDALQASLDDRTEDLVTLKRDLDQRTQLFEDNKKYLNSVELRLSQVTAMAAERDREVQTLTERLHHVEASSQVISRSRDISEEKYVKAKDDITVLSNEVESLKTHLHALRSENNDLRCRLAEALQNVASSDQMLDVKLKEHKDLLIQYGSLSKELEAMSRRNMELERTLVEVEEALQGKEAAVRNHIDRAQKAELAALSAKRNCIIAEEKVCARLTTAAETAKSRAQELDGEMEEVRRDLAATRDLAGALQARLDSTADQGVSAASDLTVKLVECERKLRDALDESLIVVTRNSSNFSESDPIGYFLAGLVTELNSTAHQREIIQQLELLLTAARENQNRLQASLDRKTEECEQLRKDTHSAHQVVSAATTEPLSVHKQFITHLKYAGSTCVATTSVTQADGVDHPLLFYKPLHPTPSVSSTVSPPHESSHVTTPISSSVTTPRGSPTCCPASSG
ncbi:unnamed protein product [Hydatigera taeniaeformis]|uniref:HAP1 N-terminal domain-containing protein n=1 Tax=Hydatigena taeniaeformis TaxID=6205 RepID=A0A0R3WHU6_HYDTA|nr:unnamed protein product [Hydatigera taeniaeformis]